MPMTYMPMTHIPMTRALSEYPGYRYFFLIIGLMMAFSSATRAEIPGVQSWAYQLQNADPQEIAANATFDLIVMDQSLTGDAAGNYTPAEIAAISAAGKIPVCYLSIGEAEDYRWYWQPDWEANPPAWLGPENASWPGNYKVRFWDPEWQAIVFQNIRAIVDQGYGGLYLDIVDAYWYWSEENPENPQADRDMAEFVIAIGDSLRAHGGSTQLLIPQNGEFIVVEDDVEGSLAESYFRAIDGIGIEDVFFYGEMDENNPWNPDVDRLEVLADYREEGVTVLSVEYLTEQGLIDQYRQAARDAGFLPYASVRALDVLNNGMIAEPSGVPGAPEIRVLGAFPNPFNPRTEIGFHANRHETIGVRIFDARGNLVTDLGWRDYAPGDHAVTWAGRNTQGRMVSSGVYFYMVEGGRDFGVGKMVLLE